MSLLKSPFAQVGVSSRGTDCRGLVGGARGGRCQPACAARRWAPTGVWPSCTAERQLGRWLDQTPPLARPGVQGGAAPRSVGPRPGGGRVWRLWVWATSAARLDARREAGRSVFREQGRSASMASGRCTAGSGVRLSSPSQRLWESARRRTGEAAGGSPHRHGQPQQSPGRRGPTWRGVEPPTLLKPRDLTSRSPTNHDTIAFPLVWNEADGIQHISTRPATRAAPRTGGRPRCVKSKYPNPRAYAHPAQSTSLRIGVTIIMTRFDRPGGWLKLTRV
jgi:hypothetical protein